MANKKSIGTRRQKKRHKDGGSKWCNNNDERNVEMCEHKEDVDGVDLGDGLTSGVRRIRIDEGFVSPSGPPESVAEPGVEPGPTGNTMDFVTSEDRVTSVSRVTTGGCVTAGDCVTPCVWHHQPSSPFTSHTPATPITSATPLAAQESASVPSVQGGRRRCLIKTNASLDRRYSKNFTSRALSSLSDGEYSKIYGYDRFHYRMRRRGMVTSTTHPAELSGCCHSRSWDTAPLSNMGKCLEDVIVDLNRSPEPLAASPDVGAGAAAVIGGYGALHKQRPRRVGVTSEPIYEEIGESDFPWFYRDRAPPPPSLPSRPTHLFDGSGEGDGGVAEPTGELRSVRKIQQLKGYLKSLLHGPRAAPAPEVENAVYRVDGADGGRFLYQCSGPESRRLRPVFMSYRGGRCRDNIYRVTGSERAYRAVTDSLERERAGAPAADTCANTC